MKSAQKIIKYVAIAFALFIIINIFSAILFGLNIFADILGLTNNNVVSTQEMTNLDFENNDISSLKIKLEVSNLIIKTGDSLKAESNNKDIKCRQQNNQLIIEENDHNWFSNKNNKGQTIVYIPEEMILDKAYIETGAGKLEIEELNAKELLLKIGVGKVEIKDLEVLEKTKIEGGVGKVAILDSELNNLNLNVGVGKFELSTKLTGKNKIEAGIGKLDINLADEIENYMIDVQKGIGSIKIDGKSVEDNTKHGSGDVIIDVEGGIGSIDINLRNQED